MFGLPKNEKPWEVAFASPPKKGHTLEVGLDPDETFSVAGDYFFFLSGKPEPTKMKPVALLAPFPPVTAWKMKMGSHEK